MLTELGGKGGCLCQPALSGEMRCPLIVRPNSEDVVTGNLFGVLKSLNPRWWLPDFLNRGLGTDRFRRQIFRRLRIELWQKQPRFPQELIEWREGNTEVDVIIRWENPATTVFIEMKYGSPVSATTVNNNGQNWPSDQLIRNARVGLYECGWYPRRDLFDVPRRDFILLLVSPTSGHPLVHQYRDKDQMKAAIPGGEQLIDLPKSPFIGELSYSEIAEILQQQCTWFNRTERLLAEDLCRYLTHKLETRPGKNGR